MQAVTNNTPSAPDTVAGDLTESVESEATDTSREPATASVAVALTAVSNASSTALLPIIPEVTETVQQIKMVEQHILPITAEPVSGQTERSPRIQTVTVHVEPLGVGVANLLTGAVEQVVKVAQGGSRRGTPRTVSPSTAAPRPGLGEGVRSVMAGVESFLQTGANLLSGLAACLQESVDCMGKVIRNPTQKPCSKQPTAQKKGPQTASSAV